jgi:phage gp36-like protein
MPYATTADLVARFGESELIQLTDRLGDGVLDAAVVSQALADADAVINGFLAGRYTLPLSPVPAILVGYACDLARERLYKDAAPEIVIKRADDARKFLALAGQGKISLGAQPEPASVGGPAHSTPGRTFDDDTLGLM